MNAIVETDSEVLPAEAAQLGSTRSVHFLAVLTLLLGLLSPLALLRTLFWFVPFVAVILGAVALRLITLDPTKCGRRLALGGMLLALLFGTWAPTRYYTRQQWITDQARVFGDAWMKLVQERKFREAHQLHGRYGDRAKQGESLDDYYQTNKNAFENYLMLYGAGPLLKIVDSTGPIQVEYAGVDLVERHMAAAQVVLRYRVTIEQKGKPEQIPLRLLLRRQRERGTQDHHWYVEGVR